MGSEGADGAVGRAAGEAGDFALTSAEGMPMNSTSGKRPSLELMTRASLHQSRNWVVNTSRLNRSQNVMGSVSKDGRKERVSGVPISMRFLRFRMMARSFSSSATGHQMILRASTLAGVTEFIRSNPAGFGAQVGERGMSLSGGQRQAVALARALVRDPDILILDEPTSNMDNASEQMIKNRLKAVMGNKTLVLITHRLSMLELVDRLIVMEGGRIIADGPKNEVLRRLREQPAPRTEQ